jgi:hypothetical protein
MRPAMGTITPSFGPTQRCGPWAPEASAEANALEAAMALQASNYYGEARLNQHVADGPSAGAPLGDAALEGLLHGNGIA